MHVFVHTCVLEKKDNVLLDRNIITSAQISIQCTKCIGNSVRWISRMSFLLVNMQYVEVLWLRELWVCCLTVYTVWLTTSSFPLTKHAVLGSLVWSTREEEMTLLQQDTSQRLPRIHGGSLRTFPFWTEQRVHRLSRLQGKTKSTSRVQRFNSKKVGIVQNCHTKLKHRATVCSLQLHIRNWNKSEMSTAPGQGNTDQMEPCPLSTLSLWARIWTCLV